MINLKKPRVYRKGDTLYLVFFDKHDKRYDFYPGLSALNPIDRAEAESIASRIEIALLRDELTPELLNSLRRKQEKKKPRLSRIQILRDYLDAKRGNWKQGTIDYNNSLLKIVEAMPPQIPASGIQNWVRSNSQKGDMSNRILGLLNRAYRLAIAQGKVSHNPYEPLIQANNILSPKKGRQKIELITLEQQERILGYFLLNYPFVLHDFLSFWFAEGWRPSEILGLHWSDFESREIVAVNRTLKETSKGLLIEDGTKTNSTRRVNLHPWTKIPNQKHSEIVFPYRGGYIAYKTTFYPKWKACLKALDIPYFKPYRIRATYINSHLNGDTSRGIKSSPISVVSQRLDTSMASIDGHYLAR